MSKTSVGNAAKTASGRPKATRKAPPTIKAPAAPAIEVAARVDENLVRERAYGIWIAEGQPHGREHAHWRAKHELLAAR